MTREEMREKVAELFCQNLMDVSLWRLRKDIQIAYRDAAEAAIAIIRGETLEEAARACDEYEEEMWRTDHEKSYGAGDIIRALKHKP